MKSFTLLTQDSVYVLFLHPENGAFSGLLGTLMVAKCPSFLKERKRTWWRECSIILNCIISEFWPLVSFLLSSQVKACVSTSLVSSYTSHSYRLCNDPLLLLNTVPQRNSLCSFPSYILCLNRPTEKFQLFSLFCFYLPSNAETIDPDL